MAIRPSVAAALALLAVAGAGCGGSDVPRAPRTAAPPAAPPPVGTQVTPQIAAGREVADRSGCLACHQIGARGNSGPGNNLAGIGTRMTPAEIRRSLLRAPAPMPSYGSLPRGKLDALVAYLSALRDGESGGPSCPDGSDCG